MRRDTISEPLLLWLPWIDPCLTSAVGRRDLERAQQLWKGEGVIWLLPNIREERRWTSPFFPWARELAIPSEALNRIDVFHVGTNAHVTGLHWNTRFTEPSIGSLLLNWLNVAEGGEKNGLGSSIAPERVKFLLPVFADESDEIRYGVAHLKLQPGGTMVLSEVSPEDGSFTLRWPPRPRASSLRSVSPAAESRSHFGDFARSTLTTKGKDLPILVSKARPETHTIHLVDRWPGSLARLFPVGGGLDAMKANVEMREIAEESETDLVKAEREAATNASRWQSEAETIRLHSWWFPQLLEKGRQGVLCELEGCFGLSFDTIDAAVESNEFRKLMTSREPIRSCHGPLGLLWTLFADELSAGLSYVRCERCRRVVQAQRRSKRFCGKDENAACYRARRASDKRRERARPVARSSKS